MFNNSIKRIGFACKYIDTLDQIHSGIKDTDDCKKYNCKTVTLQWLSKQSKENIYKKLEFLLQYNIYNLSNLMVKISSLDKSLRMIRISSDILPMYTHRLYKDFWKSENTIKYLEKNLGYLGKYCRYFDIRLSMHPGQFCVLASDNEMIRKNSIDEFEYHTDIARYMGYGLEFQDFKINVHMAGRLGINGIIESYGKLSNESRNCITIENDEYSGNINECLKLSSICPIVLDIHHNWINSGEYIKPNDIRIIKIIESWRDIRPVIHYSVSKETLLNKHDCNKMPDLNSLISRGISKTRLRAHSDLYWNNACNDLIKWFYNTCDIMCESKGKNISSFKLYDNIFK